MKVRAAAAAAACAVLVTGCSRPLPEEGSADAALYRQRCGTCHRAYEPRTLTPAMWQLQVNRMDEKFRANGMTPPAADERSRILAYLTRNAGG